MGKLDAAHNWQRENVVQSGHQASYAKKKENSSGGEASGHDLRDGEMRGGRESNSRNGLHRLHRHGDAEKEARNGIVECGKDQGCAWSDKV